MFIPANAQDFFDYLISLAEFSFIPEEKVRTFYESAFGKAFPYLSDEERAEATEEEDDPEREMQKKKTKIGKERDDEGETLVDTEERMTDEDIFYEKLVPQVCLAIIAVVYGQLLVKLRCWAFLCCFCGCCKAMFTNLHDSLRYTFFWNGIIRYIMEGYLPLSKQTLEEMTSGLKWDTPL